MGKRKTHEQRNKTWPLKFLIPNAHAQDTHKTTGNPLHDSFINTPRPRVYQTPNTFFPELFSISY